VTRQSHLYPDVTDPFERISLVRFPSVRRGGATAQRRASDVSWNERYLLF